MAFQNSFSWSISRHDCFYYCKRKYFFQYYLSWGGWEATSAARTRWAYILKNRDSLNTWKGKVAHEAIRYFIDGDGCLDLKEWVEQVRLHMSQQFEYSRQRFYLKGKGKEFGLLEHLWDEDIALSPVLEEVTTWLERFYNASLTRRILNEKKQGNLIWLDPTEFDEMSFHLEDLTVWAVPDVAFRTKGQIILIDWKTGKNRQSEGDLSDQLALYALRVMQEQQSIPEAVMGFNFYLGEGGLVGRFIQDEDLEQVLNLMAQSVQEMQACLEDPDANKPNEEAYFSKTPHEAKCTHCQFRNLCEEEGCGQ